MKTRTRLH